LVEKGRQETLRENVLKLLHRKFKNCPLNTQKKSKLRTNTPWG